jgi:NAD-dependent deacetylase
MIFVSKSKEAVCFDYSKGKTEMTILRASDEEGTDPKPLILKNQIPIKIKTIRNLADIIQSKRVIFYTGAGISSGAVPTMNELLKSLGDKNRLIINVRKNPRKYIKIFDDFFKKCEEAEPTKAHLALHSIISKTGALLITENVDLLHQKSGDNPVTRDDFSRVCKEELSRADYVIAIGLASDESGLLNLYKKLKPDGRIIAINIGERLEYLSSEDYLLLKDVQIALPELSKIYD